MIVCKFGGTSVGNTDAIRRLSRIVETRTPSRPVVVVSALAGVTNELLALADAPSRDTIEGIVERHRRTAAELGIPAAQTPDFELGGNELHDVLQRDHPGGSGARRDAVASFGELWSSRLVAAALAADGLPTEWVDIRPLMVTNDRFTRAAPDISALRKNARAAFLPLLERGRIPITQGFIGATTTGVPTTLGRGGSDYTASLLGAALSADRVEIWTDVDGIMTADPRLVPTARSLLFASDVEAAELSAFGAKVLHPATQLPLVEAGIPCVVLNSFAAERPGTTILPGWRPELDSGDAVRSIAWKKGITVVNVRAPRMLGAVGFLRALFEICARHGVSVDVLATSEVNLSLTLDDATNLEPLRHDLAELGDVTVRTGRALVAVVGTDLGATKGVAARAFTAIRGINVEVISQGASETNVALVIREEDGPEAVRLLHRAFFDDVAD
ncbi:MAG: aspartate kinase [Gemmatimonadota bacterium]